VFIRLSVRLKADNHSRAGDIILEFTLSQYSFGDTFSYPYPFVADDAERRRASRCGDSYENMFRGSWRYLQRVGYRPTPTKAVYLSTHASHFGSRSSYPHRAMLDYCIWLHLTYPHLRAL